jgi:hypothetical protein
MKFIRRFNEELKTSTYNSAADKLKKLGHEKRSKALTDWAKSQVDKSSMRRWEELKSKWSGFGKATYKFMKSSKEVMRGDFYLGLTFDDYQHLDSISYMKEERRDKSFNINFAVCLIPVDIDTLNKCKSSLPDKYFDGWYWGNWISLNYSVIDESSKFKGISISPYDEELTLDLEIVDKPSARTLKKHLMACFDESQDYPSDIIDGQKFMYDLIFETICQKLDMTAEYNLTMESMLDDVKGYSHNYFFKD